MRNIIIGILFLAAMNSCQKSSVPVTTTNVLDSTSAILVGTWYVQLEGDSGTYAGRPRLDTVLMNYDSSYYQTFSSDVFDTVQNAYSTYLKETQTWIATGSQPPVTHGGAAPVVGYWSYDKILSGITIGTHEYNIIKLTAHQLILHEGLGSGDNYYWFYR